MLCTGKSSYGHTGTKPRHAAPSTFLHCMYASVSARMQNSVPMNRVRRSLIRSAGRSGSKCQDRVFFRRFGLAAISVGTTLFFFVSAFSCLRISRIAALYASASSRRLVSYPRGFDHGATLSFSCNSCKTHFFTGSGSGTTCLGPSLTRFSAALRAYIVPHHTLSAAVSHPCTANVTITTLATQTM
jgi:hypothetical protein